MPLRGLRKFREPGAPLALDVRSLGLDLKQRENLDYPFPANIEIPVTEEQWKVWEGLEMSLSDYYYLAIINFQRTRKLVTPEMKKSLKKLLQQPSDFQLDGSTLSAWCNYCYLFSEPVTELCDGNLNLIIGYIKELHQSMLRNTAVAGWESLLNALRDARILLPEVFNDEYCEQYWKKFFTFAGDRERLFVNTLSKIRIVFPRHLEELPINIDNIIKILNGARSIDVIAWSCIIARPEIPGLTTWPPKSTEPKITDNIPEQPQNLNL